MSVDRARRFTLPGIHELNKDQDEALALPVKGQHLIIGGPGTGKSVVVLLRARRLSESNKVYGTLVYNQLLHQSNRHLFGQNHAFPAMTWDSWFRRHFQRRLGKRIPTLKPDQPGGYQAIDWNAVVQQVQQADTLELKINYRNTRPIAALAQHFYPADPASPKPALPSLETSVTTPELWTYDTDDTVPLTKMAENILQLSDRNPRKLIGIITPDNKIRQKFETALHQANPTLDHGKPPLQSFVSGQRTPLNFAQGGVMIINAQSCKGLEFDIAILADIDQHQPKRDLYTLKARFYVMAARAREQLMLLRSGRACPVVDGLLPSDPALLVRK